jgi:hypothetical protein
MRILGRHHKPLLTSLMTLVLCLVVAFTAFGCGSDKPSTKAAADQPRPVDVELPHGLSFQLPDGWSTMKSSSAAEVAASSEEFDEMSDSLGVSTEQMKQQLSAVDVFLTAPRASGGFLDNVNALQIPGPLPTAASLEMQYRAVGASAIDVEDRSTDVGTARVTTYEMTSGGNEIHGGSVAVAHADTVAVITVSTGSDRRTGQLVDQVLDTLAAGA